MGQLDAVKNSYPQPGIKRVDGSLQRGQGKEAKQMRLKCGERQPGRYGFNSLYPGQLLGGVHTGVIDAL